MIEIKFGRDENGTEVVLNKDEVYKSLEKLIPELNEKMNYYLDRYGKEAERKVFSCKAYSRPVFIRSREAIVRGESVKFFINAIKGNDWDCENNIYSTAHILISADRKNKILLFITKNPQCSSSELAIPFSSEGLFVIPIIIQDHFITRFLERRTYKENWEWEMLDEIDLFSLNVNCVYREDDFVSLSNKELIEMSEINIEFDEYGDLPIIYHSGIKRARSGAAFVMVSPKRGDMYKIKTYIPKDKLRKNQLKVLETQDQISEARREVFGVEHL